MVFNKNFVLSVFSILSLFAVVLYQLNGFLLAYCACSHLASAISAMLASMCEYWSCALQSKLSRPPEISRCRAFTWIIVVPVNRVTRVVQARYLGPPSYPGFMWTDKLSKQRNTCAPGYLGGPRYPCPPRYLASCERALTESISHHVPEIFRFLQHAND